MRKYKARVWDSEHCEMIPLFGLPEHYNEKYLTLTCQFPEVFCIMQYIGKSETVKNNRYKNDIFERDIVKFKLDFKDELIEKIGIVRCDSLASGCYIEFLPDTENSCGFDSLVSNVEIIGNEFENQELFYPPNAILVTVEAIPPFRILENIKPVPEEERSCPNLDGKGNLSFRGKKARFSKGDKKNG